MTRKLSVILAVLLLLVITSVTHAQREVIDQILVVVGDNVIMSSEVASQLQLYMFQSGRQIQSEAELKKMQANILQQMINDQLFLIEAKKDTSISIRPDEIEKSLNDQIARIKQNFDSEEAFLDALATENLTVRDLKKRYRGEIENQLLKQRFIQRKLYSVSVSKKEVEEFYNEFKDSIPSQPEGVKLGHVLLPFQASAKVEDSVKERAMELRQMILDGSDFATVSSQYSSKGAGTNGGDLGYISRDDVVPEFGRAAFNLSVGDISGVIRTQFGYHVIKCEDKKGERLKLRHLLLFVEPTPEDSQKTINLADSLLQELRNGADFADIVKVYSIDNETRSRGGELGWFAVNQLPPEFAEVVTGWKTPGEYRGPLYTQFGAHILKLLEYQEEKKFDLNQDYDKIKEMARQDKTGKMVDKWIEEIKAHTFIEYRQEE